MIEMAVLAVVATYYATVVLTQARLTDFLRPRQQDGTLRFYFTSCPLCVSPWVGAVVTLGFWRWPQVTPWVLAPLALAGAVTLILAALSTWRPPASPGVTPDQLAAVSRSIEFHIRRVMLYMDTLINKNERRLHKLTEKEEADVLAKVTTEMGARSPVSAPTVTAGSRNGKAH